MQFSATTTSQSETKINVQHHFGALPNGEIVDFFINIDLHRIHDALRQSRHYQ